MIKRKKGSLCLGLVLLMLISFTMIAGAQNNLLNSFEAQSESNLSFDRDNYFPVARIAEVLDYDFNWYFRQDSVRGDIDDIYFSSNRFMIINGKLYLSREFFREYLGLEIQYRGNTYYIYRLGTDERKDLELKLNINKSVYDYREPIAVSMLLFNKSEESISLKYTSGQKYDLVILEDEREVWRYSDGKGFIPSINTLKIDAVDYRLFTELISRDVRLSRGDYVLLCEVKTNNEVLLSNRVKFEVD